jgi:AAA domain
MHSVRSGEGYFSSRVGTNQQNRRSHGQLREFCRWVEAISVVLYRARYGHSLDLYILDRPSSVLPVFRTDSESKRGLAQRCLLSPTIGRAIIVYGYGSQAHNSMSTSANLIFFCGKMTAGKSSLARNLAARENAVLLVQDELLDSLFPGAITNVQTFVQCYSRLKNALTPHDCALLSKGVSVVLDFAAATNPNVKPA